MKRLRACSWMAAAALVWIGAASQPCSAEDPPTSRVWVVEPVSEGGEWVAFSEFCRPKNDWSPETGQVRQFTLPVEFLLGPLADGYEAYVSFRKPFHDTGQYQLADVFDLRDYAEPGIRVPNEGGTVRVPIRKRPDNYPGGKVGVCVDITIYERVDNELKRVLKSSFSRCPADSACQAYLTAESAQADEKTMRPDLNTSLIIGP